MFDKSSLKEVGKLLAAPKKIALVAHKNPDGDTVGAVLAMYHYLKPKGHMVSAIVPNEYPTFYSWMPGIEKMLIFDKDAKEIKKTLADADLIFCLDFNATHRTGNMGKFITEAKGTKIVIDHHPQPSNEFDHYFSETDTSSTGELVYEFIAGLNDTRSITKDIAVCLYTCIMTDTGSFSFSCNKKRTYEITGELIEKGVQPDLIHKLVYDTFTENRLRLLGYALSERLLVWDELHTAIISLNRDDLNRFNYQVGDTEGLVNYPLSMEKINLSVLITEKDNALRLSFRSKGDFSVNRLAREHFDGGGHKNAAGGNSQMTMEETVKQLKSVLERYKQELDYKLTYE